MKLESLLDRIEAIKVRAESEEWEKELTAIALIELLVEYIDNKKVLEAINDVPF